MKKEILKTIRFSNETIDFIESYPGKNFSDKLNTLLLLHKQISENLTDEDLEGMAYEKLVKRYMTKFHPRLYGEILERREKLNQYKDVISRLEELNTLIEEFQKEFEKMHLQATEYIKKNCSEEQENPERSSK